MECFSPHFIGMKVTFTGKNAGTWVLTEKLSDTCSQYSKFEAENLGGPSGAYGTFACKGINNPSQRAIMRIFMQIPHEGVLYTTPEAKRAQATEELDYYALTELEGYKKLCQKGCKFTPPLLNYKTEKQDAEGLIPGGYFVFLLRGQVPGVQLDSVYWDLPPPERQKIRQSFRAAWEASLKDGIHLTGATREDLVWDRDHDKIYITGTRNCEPAKPEHIWTDVELLLSGLSKTPEGRRGSLGNQVHPDTSNWTM